jgi:hypothetical protein
MCMLSILYVYALTSVTGMQLQGVHGKKVHAKCTRNRRMLSWCRRFEM